MLLCAFNQPGAAYNGNVTTGGTDPWRADVEKPKYEVSQFHISAELPRHLMRIIPNTSIKVQPKRQQ
ncbi:hypothetical protein AALO_G00071300 [Alosa alosa]|uniref:Uncharacterized protein n=1 Tax=Alosa alosa TaxID=278164 RepID=A0AAV6H425_9TELE|nr:hypothetical protein AALO_G00071300 [Alosa alosa]